MMAVKLLRMPGAELEATAPRQRRCGGSQLMQDLRLSGRHWKTGNKYSGDSRTQGGKVLTVGCETAAVVTCLCLPQQRLPTHKCPCWCVHLGTYEFIQLENKKYNLSCWHTNFQPERLF